MQKVNWDDYRVAFVVAQAGSLAKAAKILECNHTTVLRHINRLETALGVKLFIRHQRGYQLTDAGQVLTENMPDICTQFAKLEDELSCLEHAHSGAIRITTVSSYSSLLMPVMKAYRETYPSIRIELLATDEVIPPQSGAVHVALRAGPKPSDADIIVKPIMTIKMAYYASEEYVAKRGLPMSPPDYQHHDWLMPDQSKQHIPYVKQVLQHIQKRHIVYMSNQFTDINTAVISGMGIGLLSEIEAKQYTHLRKVECADLSHADPMGTLWFTYHKDLKDNVKVKDLYGFLIKHTNSLLK